MNALAAVVVPLLGGYLVALAIVSWLFPARASRFLLGFAGSAFTHYLELLVRIVVGAAVVMRAPAMAFSGVFLAFGWVLVITTAALAMVPWQWHQRFAQRAVPLATRHLPLVGAASFLFGGLVIASVVLGGLR